MSGTQCSQGGGPHLPRSRDPELSEIVDFVLQLDGLKDVQRQNPTADGRRRERTAEHSWHVALAVYLLARFAREEVDAHRAVTLAVFHDIPEVVVGDTFVYGPAEGTRREREEGAVEWLVKALPGQESANVYQAWREYEYLQSPEGRFVMAIDVILPIFLNLAAGRESSWVEHSVSESAVRRRLESVREFVPTLAELASDAISQAVKDGHLIGA
jgi:putative hydrolases of HD superfamily